jgi:hypothetical protein
MSEILIFNSGYESYLSNCSGENEEIHLHRQTIFQEPRILLRATEILRILRDLEIELYSSQYLMLRVAYDKQTKELRGLSPNYTDRATATCWRN